MANVSGQGTSWNLPNYLGALYLMGANQTPFLNMIGGLQGGRARLVSHFEHALASTWDLETAAQPAIDETTSATAPTATSYVRGQDKNTCQIFQESVNVTYKKLSLGGSITADATTGLVGMDDVNSVEDELDFQINANMKQIAVNCEYSMLNGVYQQATDAGTAAKMRGIVTACSTNAVNASSADLSRDLVNELLRTMAANGSQFINPVIFVNAFQKQRLSEIFGYAPADRNVGGLDIKQIETDFAMLGIVWAPHMVTSTLLIADLAVCQPVFCPVPSKGVLFYEELAKAGAAEQGQIYGQIGLDYGPEEFHGKITNLTTS